MGGRSTEHIFIGMLSKFEKMTLEPNMRGLAETYDSLGEDVGQSAYNFKFKTHQLKGAASYIGAGQIYYACHQVLEMYNEERFNEMYDYYPTIVEYACMFPIETEKLVHRSKGNHLFKVFTDM